MNLGELKRVELRTIWSDEAVDFTPWLAQPQNLDQLNQTLGLDLQLEAIEKEVDSFYADIVCKDIGTDSTVLIENQLERTNHDHLGKLLTYAAGLQSVTVIWLAKEFRDEHRAALDWLNDISNQDTSFFGLEIELWQIGDSAIAPKFNIVSMPNDWSRSVSKAASDSSQQSELRNLQRKYWETFVDVLKDAGGPVRGNQQPRAKHYMTYGIGISSFHLAAVIHERQAWLRVELYLKGNNAETNLARLINLKDEIEEDFEDELVWGDQLESARDRRVSYYLRDVDLNDESEWPRQHQWIVQNLNNFHRVFSPRLADLLG